MKHCLRSTTTLTLLGLALAAAPALRAGPFILAGTDADDHGFASGGVNQDGWFFMQRALENLASGVTNGNTHVVFLASDPGSSAGNAALSAFTNSSLPGLGWTSEFIDGAAAIDTYLAGGAATAGILMMDSASNVSGGADAAELTAFSNNATNIDSFLGAGGGLFSQANDYDWVSALLPALVVQDLGGGGLGDPLSLTAAGMAAFPGLTNADLSSGPYHNIFTNPAGLPILATNSAGQAVVIGSSGGTVTNPNPPTGVPDSGSFLAIYAAIAGAMIAFRRRVAARLA